MKTLDFAGGKSLNTLTDSELDTVLAILDYMHRPVNFKAWYNCYPGQKFRALFIVSIN